MSRLTVIEVINTAIDGDKVYERVIKLSDGSNVIYVEDNSNLDFELETDKEYEFDLIIDFKDVVNATQDPYYKNEDNNTFLYTDNSFKLGKFEFKFTNKPNPDLQEDHLYKLSIIFIQVLKISIVKI